MKKEILSWNLNLSEGAEIENQFLKGVQTYKSNGSLFLLIGEWWNVTSEGQQLKYQEEHEQGLRVKQRLTIDSIRAKEHMNQMG